ncbi:MAG: hypothetical protein D3911_11605 [Candidatus Electrothrix sp. AW3_4]|nr:hypothetical protein [Candidatus Electrothrix gigas]
MVMWDQSCRFHFYLLFENAPYSSRAPGFGRTAAMAEPGTGVGEREDSFSRRVDFTAKPYPLEKHLFKYEWRESLCEKKIISCNRLWDNDYVQPPPGERRW